MSVIPEKDFIVIIIISVKIIEKGERGINIPISSEQAEQAL